MVDYKKLYATLCYAASQALDLMPGTPENAAARFCLETALEQAEEAYILCQEDSPGEK